MKVEGVSGVTLAVDHIEVEVFTICLILFALYFLCLLLADVLVRLLSCFSCFLKTDVMKMK